jgi:predicted glycosyltransferase
MRLLIDIFHPSNVHFFKNFMWQMQQRGHQVLVAAKDKDVNLKLLEACGFAYKKTGRYGRNLMLKAAQMLKIDYELFELARDYKPDILIGQGAVNAAHVSSLIGKPCILFADDEYSLFLYRSFADVICTLGSFKKDIGKKQIRIDSYKELAYLHPRYFTPDPSALEELNIKNGERFVIIRFVAWTASHDFGRVGFDLPAQKRLVREVEKYARVFISVEGVLPPELESYRLRLAPEKMHHLLFYANMFIGDGQTMATESAVLGTPAVRCNTFVGPGDMAQFVELEKEYGLIFSFRDAEMAISKTIELLAKKDIKNQWQGKRQRLLEDKADITEFMVDFVENYPASFNGYKKKRSIS